MPRKVIISLAPVRSGTPVDRFALAEDVAKCVEKGAAMCHLHCRLPDGSLTPDTTEFIATFEAKQVAAKFDQYIPELLK